MLIAVVKDNGQMQVLNPELFTIVEYNPGGKDRDARFVFGDSVGSYVFHGDQADKIAQHLCDHADICVGPDGSLRQDKSAKIPQPPGEYEITGAARDFAGQHPPNVPASHAFTKGAEWLWDRLYGN